MKKLFEEPKVDVLMFAVNDVITASNEDEGYDGPALLGDCI